MRIRVTGEKSIIDDLGAELARDGGQVEPQGDTIDRAELALGLLEAAAIIAIVANMAKLIEYLVVIARHLRDGEKRRLEVKTAAGATFVDIDNKSTPENLEKQLSAIGGAAGTTSGTPSGSTSGGGSGTTSDTMTPNPTSAYGRMSVVKPDADKQG